MAARQEAGYRLASSDWDDYNKQLGGALEFAGLPRWRIELRQLTGYLAVFVRNGRFLDLLAFCWRFRRSGLELARKILQGSWRTSRQAPVPPSEAARARLAEAADRWRRLQSLSARQSRRDAPAERTRVVARSPGCSPSDVVVGPPPNG